MSFDLPAPIVGAPASLQGGVARSAAACCLLEPTPPSGNQGSFMTRFVMGLARLPRRPLAGSRFASAFVLGLSLAVTGTSGPGRVDGTLAAQASNPCALLTTDEIESSVPKSDVAEGVATAFPGFGYAACQYVWGVGAGRFRLDVAVTETARMFPGMGPDQIKEQLIQSVRTGSHDALISDIGEAAVFKPASPVYATATSLVKGRILQVHLEGAFAGEMKNQVAELLKLAASRM